MTVKELIDYLKNFREDKEVLFDDYDVDTEDIERIIYENSPDSVNIDMEMAKICHNAVPEILWDEIYNNRRKINERNCEV